MYFYYAKWYPRPVKTSPICVLTLKTDQWYARPVKISPICVLTLKTDQWYAGPVKISQFVSWPWKLTNDMHGQLRVHQFVSWPWKLTNDMQGQSRFHQFVSWHWKLTNDMHGQLKSSPICVLTLKTDQWKPVYSLFPYLVIFGLEFAVRSNILMSQHILGDRFGILGFQLRYRFLLLQRWLQHGIYKVKEILYMNSGKTYLR